MSEREVKLNRRKFLRSASVGGMGLAAVGTAGAVAAPALAKGAPQITWRLTSSFPSTLETIHGAREVFVKAVADATDAKFKIEFTAAKDNATPFATADAVTKGGIEMVQTSCHYFAAKDPIFAFGSGLPFGLNARQMNSWMLEGGGMELMGDVFAKHNIHAIPAGNTGCQMGGWWRSKIETLDDLQGKKIVTGGFAGRIIKRLGAEPLSLPGSEIAKALESGKVDGVEWVGPHDDEKLGLHKVAKTYYYPGWWETGMMIHIFVNRAKWETLPKNYQAILTAAGQTANAVMLARYDAKNPAALKRLLRKGIKLRAFSTEIMNAAFEASEKTNAELAATNPNFKRVYENWRSFRADQYLWSQVAELGIDTFQAGAVNRR